MSDQLLTKSDIEAQADYARRVRERDNPRPTVVGTRMSDPQECYRLLRTLGTPRWLAVIVAARAWVRGRLR